MHASFTRRSLSVWLLAAVAAWPARARGAGGLELVMVERAGCGWCARWNAEIAPLYGKTAEAARAPLRRHDLAAGQPAEAGSPVRFTPTFLLAREGREIGRITGYLDAGMFWGMLGQLLEKVGRS